MSENSCQQVGGLCDAGGGAGAIEPAPVEEILHVQEIGDHYKRIKKVAISQKCLTLTCDSGGGFLTKMTFRKGSDKGVDYFTFVAQETKPDVKTKKCDMGHDHVISRSEKKTEYAHIRLPWDQAERIIDWFQTGTWREVRRARE